MLFARDEKRLAEPWACQVIQFSIEVVRGRLTDPDKHVYRVGPLPEEAFPASLQSRAYSRHAIGVCDGLWREAW